MPAEQWPPSQVPAEPIGGVPPWEPAQATGLQGLQLAHAVQAHDELEVIWLPEDSTTPDSEDQLGEALLSDAASCDKINVAAAVPMISAEPGHRSRMDTLANAVRGGDALAVMRLLEDGTNPDSTDQFGETLLFDAASRDSIDVAAALLLSLADPGHRSDTNATADDLARGKPMASLLQLFQGVQVDAAARSALAEALSPQMWTRVRMRLLDPDSPASEVEGIFAAVRAGEVSDVLRMLRAGADPNVCNADGETPLFEAASSENLDTAAALLTYRADPMHRSHGNDSASNYCRPGSEMQALCSLFQGEDVEDDRMEGTITSLSSTIRPMVILHLQGASRQRMGLAPTGIEKHMAQEEAGSTKEDRLAAAVKLGVLEAVWSLLKDGANPNVADAVGETPLFEAARNGDSDVVALLLIHSADPCRVSQEGDAARRGANEDISRLLDFFQGIAEEEESVDLKCLSPLRERVRKAVVQHMQDRAAEAPLAILDTTTPQPLRLAVKRQLEGERAAREALERRLADLEAQVTLLETLFEPMPMRRRPGKALAARALQAGPPGPDRSPSGRSSPSGAERYEVVQSPCVAIRSAPSVHGETVCRLPRGTTVALAEWDASREWRRIAEAPGSFNTGVDSWVPVFHSVGGTLLRPLDEPEDPASAHCDEDFPAARKPWSCRGGSGELLVSAPSSRVDFFHSVQDASIWGC